ncbi:type II toxin-antitoxin system VapC family toxin [[Phormidium] sp. ETS-05]|uniref:type II toxin-antitoxin system VapC family toxin n=1 Tax=[Phormidium] sp. ETS-05 TaxID=222819 RepID=UPI0018EEED86|nr:type II toxin-antitoxin system VapC family toxin [[Phormidium] sp. ETS-05]
MSISRAILDTDILSAILRQNPVALRQAQDYLLYHKQLTFSIITRYEILRGLKAKGATKQIKAFDDFCSQNIILPITDETVVKAADIYADLRQRGVPIGDADILIAASALIRGWAVVTNNEAHFQRIPELQVINWLNSEL